MKTVVLRSFSCLVLLLIAGAVQAEVYSEAVLADNPYAYWRMGELIGTTALDAAPNSGLQEGSYHQFASDGYPTLGVAGIPGGADTAVEFHGGSPTSQAYVADTVNPTAYTLEAWVKADAGATTGRNIMVRTASNPMTTLSHQLRIEPTGKFRHFVYDGGSRFMDSSTIVQADQWYHVVGVATQGAGFANHLDVYVNGVKESEADWNGGAFWNGGSQWRIGSIAGSNAEERNWFDGTIDEVALYHHDIGPDAVLRHYQAGITPATLSRQLATQTPSFSLDLADMVGGGDGTGTGTFDAGINPGDGSLITAGTLNPGMVTGAGYHAVSALPFVDGAFIPGVNAGGQMQVDSTGATVAYPDRDARSWGHLRNGPTGGVSPVLGGIDYTSAGHSLIGAHANKGITFDLDAIRAANPGYELGQFSTVYGDVDAPGGNSEVNFYLDGRLMYGKGGTLTTATPVQVGISASDRFLTLVASDGGNTYGNDQLMFGDPTLELAQNVALAKPATAWASYNASYAASNLTDGELNDQPGSFWLAPNAETGDVIVDLDGVLLINRVDLQNTHNVRHNDRGTNAFGLLVSEDGLAWTEVADGALTQFTSSTTMQNIPIETFTFPEVWARYVKVRIDSYHGAGAGLNEIRILATAPEPSTLLLALLAFCGTLALLRRRR